MQKKYNKFKSPIAPITMIPKSILNPVNALIKHGTSLALVCMTTTQAKAIQLDTTVNGLTYHLSTETGQVSPSNTGATSDNPWWQNPNLAEELDAAVRSNTDYHFAHFIYDAEYLSIAFNPYSAYGYFDSDQGNVQAYGYFGQIPPTLTYVTEVTAPTPEVIVPWKLGGQDAIATIGTGLALGVMRTVKKFQKVKVER